MSVHPKKNKLLSCLFVALFVLLFSDPNWNATGEKVSATHIVTVLSQHDVLELGDIALEFVTVVDLGQLFISPSELNKRFIVNFGLQNKRFGELNLNLRSRSCSCIDVPNTVSVPVSQTKKMNLGFQPNRLVGPFEFVMKYSDSTDRQDYTILLRGEFVPLISTKLEPVSIGNEPINTGGDVAPVVVEAPDDSAVLSIGPIWVTDINKSTDNTPKFHLELAGFEFIRMNSMQVDVFGEPFETLRVYLESKSTDGMSINDMLLEKGERSMSGKMLAEFGDSSFSIPVIILGKKFLDISPRSIFLSRDNPQFQVARIQIETNIATAVPEIVAEEFLIATLDCNHDNSSCVARIEVDPSRLDGSRNRRGIISEIQIAIGAYKRSIDVYIQ